MSFICLRIVDLPDSPAPVEPGLSRQTNIQKEQLTEQKHLYFVPLLHLVALELVLDLIVPGLAIPVFCAHTTPHFDEYKAVMRKERRE